MFKQRFALLFLLVCVSLPLLAQAGERTLTVHYSAYLSPVIALIAGILILIMPRLLNYVVAIYLILVGLIGIFGR
jgi:hypothetical protein